MKNKNVSVKEELNQFLLYTAPTGQVKVEVLFSDESIWATQEIIAQLFGVQRPAITKHLKNIFESGELQEQVVSSILEHTTQHGAISADQARKKAIDEYQSFNKNQNMLSDFEKEVLKKLEKN